jgi:hypothetical protein
MNELNPKNVVAKGMLVHADEAWVVESEGWGINVGDALLCMETEDVEYRIHYSDGRLAGITLMVSKLNAPSE